MEYYSLYIILKGIEGVCEKIKVPKFLLSNFLMRNDYFNRVFFERAVECVKMMKSTTNSVCSAEFFGVNEDFISVLTDSKKEEDFLDELRILFEDFQGFCKEKGVQTTEPGVGALDFNRAAGRLENRIEQVSSQSIASLRRENGQRTEHFNYSFTRTEILNKLNRSNSASYIVPTSAVINITMPTQTVQKGQVLKDTIGKLLNRYSKNDNINTFPIQNNRILASARDPPKNECLANMQPSPINSQNIQVIKRSIKLSAVSNYHHPPNNDILNPDYSYNPE